MIVGWLLLIPGPVLSRVTHGTMASVAITLVQLDVYPARVRLPHGGTVEPARVIVADSVLSVWISSTGTPRVFFTRPALSVEGSRMSGYGIQVEDGVVVVARADGCACGDTLRSFDPFGGKTPTVVG